MTKNESICSICGKPEEITGTDGAGELTYKPHKHEKKRMTLKTTMTITMRSRMTMPITVETEKGDKGYSKQFQKELHRGLAYAIFNAVEHARDDNNFDQTALDDLYIDPYDFGIKGDPEISDFAEISLEYKDGKKVWKGERIPTKAERANQ